MSDIAPQHIMQPPPAIGEQQLAVPVVDGQQSAPCGSAHSVSPVQAMLLALIVVTYLALGSAYALRTPLWQVPDEPAHYNYVAHVAATGHPPRIEAGDYPFDRLERLKAERFPAGSSIAGIEYEDHQPPLYYYLAAVPLRLAGADIDRRVRAIRLFGVMLGTLTVLLAWTAGRRLDSSDAALGLGAAAMVAFLPMHLTMTAAVNNDPLANLLAASIVVVCLERLTGRLGARRFAAIAGILLGMALLTKATVYGLAVLPAVTGATRLGGASRVRHLAAALLPVAIGLSIALPWFARNAALYGAHDPLGLARHDEVVVGQPRTVDWIADHGWPATAERMVTFTFRSFWGVFGWMGVFLAPWMYAALAAASAAATVGLALAGPHLIAAPQRRRQLALHALAIAVVGGGFLAYNVGFVQHQGRYLFPALVPLAVCTMIGVREVGRRTAIVARVIPARHGTAAPDQPAPDQPAPGRVVGQFAIAAYAAALAALAVISLQRYIVPGLS